MSNVSTVFIAVITVAVIYVLCRMMNDQLNEEPGLLPGSRIAVAGILLLLLWYGVRCIQGSFGTFRSYSGATMGTVSLFVLLLALLVWGALKH